MEKDSEPSRQPCKFCSCAMPGRLWKNYSVDAWALFHSPCSSCSDAEAEHPANSLCEFCRHLRLRHFLNCVPAERYTLKIGTLLERDANCQLCHFLTNIIHNQTSLFFGLSSATVDNRQIHISIAKPGPALRWQLEEDYFYSGVIQKVSPEKTDPNDVFKRFVDWNQIRSWVSLPPVGVCEPGLNHKKDPQCYPVKNFKVIDISKSCIIDAPEFCEYVTLSYVWGNKMSGRCQATLSNIKMLETPGGLISIGLPVTLSDALEACGKLGQKYLWIDALCIIQDDIDNKQYQINHMDRIYEGAAFCIVAAAGRDVTYGLPGVSHSRLWEGVEVVVYDLKLSARLDSASQCISASKWNSRAWTFQESILSKRLLFFTDFGVFYYDREASGEKYLMEQTTCFNSTAADQMYMSDDHNTMLFAYTHRELSFNEDILKAFSGVLNRKFKGATTYGLPCEAFDRPILWKTDDYMSASRDSKPGSLFPSWSWTSAFGTIRFVDGYGIACWAIVTPTPGTNSKLTFMVPSPEYQTGYGFFDSHGFGVACGLAWSLGCIAKEHPADLEFNCSAKEYEKRLHAKWKLYTDYWTDAFSSLLTNQLFPKADVEAARSAGRLLVYTQEAIFGIDWMNKSDQKFPGRQDLLIRSKDGSLAGLISLGIHQTKKLGPTLRNSAKFIALSVTLDSGSRLKPTRCPTCKTYFISEFWLESKRDHCKMRDVDGLDSLTNPELSVDKQSKPMYPPGIYFTDSDGSPIPSWREPIMIHVMLIQNVNSDDDRIVQRLGIGKIYLKKWAQAERQFKSFVLE